MNTCRTCRHKDIDIINASIVARVPFRTIANRFSISSASLKRHALKCIPELLSKAEAGEILKADKILQEAQTRRAKINELFEIAATSSPPVEDEDMAIKAIKGDREFALRAGKAAKEYDELLLKSRGQWLEKIGVELTGEVKGLSPEELTRWKRLVAAVYVVVPDKGDEIMEKAGIDLPEENHDRN